MSLLVSLVGLLLIVGTGSDGSPLDWRGIGGIVLLLACFSGVLNNVINVIFDAVEGGVLNLFLLIAGQA